MEKREKRWRMFTEFGDPLAYVAYGQSAGKPSGRIKKYENL